MLIIKYVWFAILMHFMDFSPSPFLGDVTDKNYVKQQKISQIIKTDSSAATFGQIRTTTFTFDTDGVLTDKKEVGKEILTTRFMYDKIGHLLEAITLRADGSVYRSEKIIYDEKHRIKESELKCPSEKMAVSDNVVWVDDFTRHTTRVKNGETLRFLNAFNKQNQLVDETFDNGNGYVNIYNGTVLLMKKSKSNGKSTGIERYEYDDNMHVKLIENPQSRRFFYYEANGLLTKTETKDANERKIAFERFEYVKTNQ